MINFLQILNKEKLVYYIKHLNLRLFYCCLTILLTFICSYIYSDALIYLFIKPFLIKMYSNRFIFTSLLEVFLTYIKFSFIVSCFASFPIIIFQLWLFFIPGFYIYEKKKINIFCILIYIFFLVSLFIGYFIVLPSIWNFFLKFDNTNLLFPLHFEAKINDYLFLMLSILIKLIICFQIPPILIILTSFKLINKQFFILKKKIFYLLFLLLSTLVSSPEILSQILLFFLFIIFYEIGIFTIYLIKNYIT